MMMHKRCYAVLAALLSLACSAILMLAEPVVRYVAIGCDEIGDGMSKLYRELAHKFNESAEPATGVGAGLSRESNGFRQVSATKEWSATDVRPDIMLAHG